MIENLLQETIDELKDHGYSPSDVLWCGTTEHCFSWEIFKELANRDYDASFGCREVARDLLVVGKNWWLERHEYDGSEWWEFKQQPQQPTSQMIPQTLFTEYMELYERQAVCDGNREGNRA